MKNYSPPSASTITINHQKNYRGFYYDEYFATKECAVDNGDYPLKSGTILNLYIFKQYPAENTTQY
ncbi:MAG: hypothetical protein ACOCV8_02005 [Spirochaetota bacterium]